MYPRLGKIRITLNITGQSDYACQYEATAVESLLTNIPINIDDIDTVEMMTYYPEIITKK